VPRDSSRPYRYTVTWSVEDLLEEYVRPARIRRQGRIVEVPALSGLVRIEIPGVGELEAFYTDGLRSLLRLDIPSMEEMTLRWPGHVDQIRPLIADGSFVETIRRSCTFDRPDDIVVIRIEIRRGDRTEETLIVDRFDGRRTAMTRTTALTCSAVALRLAGGGLHARGVLPMETLGRDEETCRHVLSHLAGRGVRIG
jgi:saccharopine dehydrogenase-like NADP-dependent oxidoreductase